MNLSKQRFPKFSEISNQGCKRGEWSSWQTNLPKEYCCCASLFHNQEGCLKGIIWLFNASGKETLSLQITGVLAGILKRMWDEFLSIQYFGLALPPRSSFSWAETVRDQATVLASSQLTQNIPSSSPCTGKQSQLQLKTIRWNSYR